jgi:hypothetical protein
MQLKRLGRRCFEIKTERLIKSGGVLERAIRQGSLGLDTVPFPVED